MSSIPEPVAGVPCGVVAYGLNPGNPSTRPTNSVCSIPSFNDKPSTLFFKLFSITDAWAAVVDANWTLNCLPRLCDSTISLALTLLWPPTFEADTDISHQQFWLLTSWFIVVAWIFVACQTPVEWAWIWSNLIPLWT